MTPERERGRDYVCIVYTRGFYCCSSSKTMYWKYYIVDMYCMSAMRCNSMPLHLVCTRGALAFSPGAAESRCASSHCLASGMPRGAEALGQVKSPD